MKSLFFNSIDNDRVYNASDFAEYFQDYFTNGIFYRKSDSLQVSTDTQNIIVAKGRANINGYAFINDTVYSVPLVTGGANNPRYDAVMLTLNLTNREITIDYVQGTESASPTKVAPIRSGNIYQLVLAYIYVDKQVTTITNANIEDTRFSVSLCGIVSQTVTTINVETLYNSMQSKLDDFYTEKQDQFIAWFNLIQGLLEGDYVANLASEVLELQNNQDTVFKTTGVDDNIKLKTVIDSFLSVASDNMRMTVKVIGDLFSCQNAINLNGVDYALVFGGKGTNRKIVVDFSRCAVIDSPLPIYADSQAEITGLKFNCTGNNPAITSNGARIEKSIINGTTGAITGTHTIAKDCKLKAVCAVDFDRVKTINCGGYFENCDMVAEQRSDTTVAGNTYGAFAVYAESLDFPLNIVGGSAIAHIKTNSQNEAVGVYVAPYTTGIVLNVKSCRVAQTVKTGLKQTESIKLNSGYGSVIGCALYQEAKIYSTVNFLVGGNNVVNMNKGLN